MNPYVPTEDVKVLRLIKEAAVRNMQRDKIEREHGETPVSLLRPSRQMRVAIDAITCGLALHTQDRGGWQEVADGLAMLVQAEYAVRQLDEQLDIVMKDNYQNPEAN